MNHYASDVPADISTIDLFSGAGGLTAGMHSASNRFSPTIAVELDHAAAATYQQNHQHTIVVNEPIQDWVSRSGDLDAQVIVGGPPCQGFSALGRQDENDARNFLWEQYAHVILKARPKYFVVENVAQFLDSKQFVEFLARTEPGGPLADYDLSARGVLDAADYGAFQTRKRTVLIGRHRDLPSIGLPAPTHTRSNWRTVREALQDVEPCVRAVDTDLPEGRSWQFNGKAVAGEFKTSELHLTRTYEPLSLARFSYIPSGGNRFDIPLALQPECWRKHRTGAGDVMGRLRWDKPSVTIRTEFVKPEKGRYLHPDEDRAITIMEGALLQGFDPDYLWCGSKASIAKQIGNAVPLQLGAAIGRVLADAL